MLKIRELINDQEGSILPITVAFILVALLLLAAVVDFGRYTVVREKLQTATDAASLAGAKSVDRMVELEITLGQQSVECSSGEGICCAVCRDPAGTGNTFITVRGKEAYLLDSNGWRSYCCGCAGDTGECSYRLINRWVNYTNSGNDAITAARSYFNLNQPPETEAVNGGSATALIDASYLSETRRSDALYPSIFVRSQAKISTLMLGIFNIISPGLDASEMDMSTCSQGRTYYKDPNTGRWEHPPNSNCAQ